MIATRTIEKPDRLPEVAKPGHVVFADGLCCEASGSKKFLKFAYRPPAGHKLLDLCLRGYWDRAVDFGIAPGTLIEALICPTGNLAESTLATFLVLSLPSNTEPHVTVGLLSRHHVTPALKAMGD